MCSILKYKSCVGRNFDYEVSFDEKVMVIERSMYDNQYKVMGMTTGFVQNYPLLYDGINEHGLCMGGLAFEGNTVYNIYNNDYSLEGSIPCYDFVLRILGEFKTVEEVKNFLNGPVQITDKPYSNDMPASDLHWFIADKNDSIIVEQTNDGLNVYEGEIMTNNPPYPNQVKLCNKLMTRIGKEPNNLKSFYSRGFETFGLLGDYTSMGRFERLSYLKEKMIKSPNPFDDVTSAFHLLSSVEQVYGATPVNDKFEYTIYSVVYDMDKKSMYIKLYDDLVIKIRNL